MHSLIRTFRLSARLAAAGRIRFVLLSALMALSVTVFLVVSELSRVSSEGLDTAIAEDVGATGLYFIDMDNTLGMTPAELTVAISAAVAPLSVAPLKQIDAYPLTASECPPLNALGATGINIIHDAAYRPLDMPFGSTLPVDTEFCFAGQHIPADAIYVPTVGEQRNLVTGLWSGIFVHPDYARLVEISTTGPIQRRFVLATGRRDDVTDEVRRLVMTVIDEAATRYGIDPINIVNVGRTDNGQSVRAANEGIKAVYSVIGWGVLLTGALGLAAAEMISVKNRSWFYGLSRAIGARRDQIVLLIVFDIALVLVAGTLLSLALAAVGQPAAATFARNSFDVEVHLITFASISRLFASTLLVLLVAATVPAVIASRQDPIDVIEPRGE